VSVAARVAAAVTACLLLASCTGSTGTGASTVSESRVDVDTPQLRALKAGAGVAACRRGTASSELPRITLPCLGGGRAVDLSSLRGPLVVNLFAQWCGPCREELPYYQELHRKGRGVVRVVGIDYLDVRPDRALELVEQTGVTYPLLADPAGDLRAALKVRGLPGVVFVKADGTVVTEYRVVRSYAELRGLVRDRLGVRVPA
jgi:thiol-disulfide isomerase/thioredoxin